MALRNRLTNQYFSYDEAGQRVTATGSPPSIRVSHAETQTSESLAERRENITDQFRLVSCTARDNRTGVVYGSKVFLINA